MFLDDKQTYLAPPVSDPVRDALIKARALYASKGFYKPNVAGCAIMANHVANDSNALAVKAGDRLNDFAQKLYGASIMYVSDYIGMEAGLRCYDEAIRHE